MCFVLLWLYYFIIVDSNVPFTNISWWRHQMDTFSVLLALCVGNSPVTGEFPSQRPVTQSSDVFCAWINGSVNNCEAGDLRCLCAHYHVIVMSGLFHWEFNWPSVSEVTLKNMGYTVSTKPQQNSNHVRISCNVLSYHVTWLYTYIYINICHVIPIKLQVKTRKYFYSEQYIGFILKKKS